jgi:hypothetical protein
MIIKAKEVYVINRIHVARVVDVDGQRIVMTPTELKIQPVQLQCLVNQDQ